MKINRCSLIEVLSCDKNEDIVDIARKLRDRKERHIVVLDSGMPVGIISVVDIVNRFVAEKKGYGEVKAGDIMTSPLIVKDSEDKVISAYVDMVKNGVLSCPVVGDGKFKGNLMISEAMKRLTEDGEK